MGSGFEVQNPNVVASCGCGSSFRVKDRRRPAAACASSQYASASRARCRASAIGRATPASAAAATARRSRVAGRRRHLVQPVRALDRAPDPEVAHRQDVGPAEVEDQEHVGRPLAESFHRRELGGHLVVGKLRQPVELELPGLHVLGERTQVADLRARDPRPAPPPGRRPAARPGSGSCRRTDRSAGCRSCLPPWSRAAARRWSGRVRRRPRAGGRGDAPPRRAGRARRPAGASRGRSSAADRVGRASGERTRGIGCPA